MATSEDLRRRKSEWSRRYWDSRTPEERVKHTEPARAVAAARQRRAFALLAAVEAIEADVGEQS